jgi:hypothetical protein
MVFVMFLSGSTSLSAEVMLEDLSIQHEKEILEGFTELGINHETQEKLIDKLTDGELLDSMSMKNINLEIDTSNLGESKNITFPDGSKVEYGSEILSFTPEVVNKEPEISLLGDKKELEPGTYKIRTYWNTVLVNQDFVADVKIRSGNNNDYIIDIYEGGAAVVGGKLISNKTTLARRTESSTYYASANQKVEYQLFGEDFGMSGSVTTNLMVGNDGYFNNIGSESYRK